ncbi:hypothetical protein JL720_4696 [Aureococcus anophagefferens]|nr:hypothetical protein JL720_4696 [Aureococcus anophagefferens]
MQQPRGPATLCIKAKEIDALYDALGKIQRAFAAAAIPWTLTGGSALGAVRSASILFCDDDVDLAVLGREHFERARAARDPRAAARARGRPQRPVLGPRRGRRQRRRSGAALPADAWPLWHFGEIEARGAGLAIQKWPGEFVTRPELPFRGGGHAFGPLADVPLPPRPLTYLVRAFGDDCLAVYYVDREHEQYRTGNAAGAPPPRRRRSRPSSTVRSCRRATRASAATTASRGCARRSRPWPRPRARGAPRLPPPRLLVVSNGPVAGLERDAGHGRYALGWGAPIRAADVVRAAAGYEAVVCAAETVCANDLEPLRRGERAGAGCALAARGARAAPSLLDGFLLADGDLVCDAEVFDRVARFPGSCAAVARPSPLAASSEDAEARRCLTNARHQITKIGKAIGPGSVGECVGLYGVSGAAVAGARLPFFLDASEASEYYEDSFDRALRAGGPRRLDMVALDVTGFACVEVDDGEDLAAAVGAVGVTARHPEDGRVTPCEGPGAEDALPAADDVETVALPEAERLDYARMKEELEAMKRTNADARALFRGLEIDDIDADLDALAGRPPVGDAAPAWNTR